VNPSIGTFDTPFEFVIELQDDNEDSVALTLEVFDPSSRTYENVGSRVVEGTGTATWTDVMIFEQDDAGTTAYYRVRYDDGDNLGMWGPFSGPGIWYDDTQGPLIRAFSAEEWNGNGDGVFQGCESVKLTYELIDATGIGDISLTLDGVDQNSVSPTSAVVGPLCGGYYLMVLTVTDTHPNQNVTVREGYIKVTPVDGDLTHDCVINSADCLEVFKCLDQRSSPISEHCWTADLTNDFVVDVLDIAELQRIYGTECGSWE
jgi:hypothetical protein